MTVSNSFLFALKGARGICFEPVRLSFRSLRALYALNSRVLCVGEGSSEKEEVLEIRSDNLLSSIIRTEDAGLDKLLTVYRDPDAE
jgi:hypothetical protein